MASVVSPPYGKRVNTGDNTPAVVHIELVPGDTVEVKLAAKGGGSENKSRFTILNPSDDLIDWEDRPPMIIDESDGHLSSCFEALDAGYIGTSHKNCKGVFKGVANACLIEHRNRQGSNPKLVLSGEDLGNRHRGGRLPVPSPPACRAVHSSHHIDDIARRGAEDRVC